MDKTEEISIIDEKYRITAEKLKEYMLLKPPQKIVIDVRENIQYKICSLSCTKNIPLKELSKQVFDKRAKRPLTL